MNGKPSVRNPFNTYKNKNGELCFRQIIDLPDEVRGKVDTAILSEDCLNGLVWKDDSQIVILKVMKFYSEEPKTLIFIEEGSEWRRRRIGTTGGTNGEGTKVPLGFDKYVSEGQ